MTIAVNRNLSNCEIAQKKRFFGASVDSNLWPLRSRCSALPNCDGHILISFVFPQFTSFPSEFYKLLFFFFVLSVNCRNICFSTISNFWPTNCKHYIIIMFNLVHFASSQENLSQKLCSLILPTLNLRDNFLSFFSVDFVTFRKEVVRFPLCSATKLIKYSNQMLSKHAGMQMGFVFMRDFPFLSQTLVC